MSDSCLGGRAPGRTSKTRPRILELHLGILAPSITGVTAWPLCLDLRSVVGQSKLLKLKAIVHMCIVLGTITFMMMRVGSLYKKANQFQAMMRPCMPQATQHCDRRSHPLVSDNDITARAIPTMWPTMEKSRSQRKWWLGFFAVA
ncbi:hypothetical protein DE146DRAFT_278331 [Phaeosphaeria sp. MPI-PUGE-AT-0046c]|nr:hypothetical protein DE146DRAFT_278331 [Phaeosphaeria sp. MPI-PUGE-AT-0046c]